MQKKENRKEQCIMYSVKYENSENRHPRVSFGKINSVHFKSPLLMAANVPKRIS